MKVTFSVLGLALIVPALLVAIALGPVIVGVLCAVGCAMLVAAIGNLLVVVGRSAERAGVHLVRRPPRW